QPSFHEAVTHQGYVLGVAGALTTTRNLTKSLATSVPMSHAMLAPDDLLQVALPSRTMTAANVAPPVRLLPVVGLGKSGLYGLPSASAPPEILTWLSVEPLTLSFRTSSSVAHFLPAVTSVSV